MCDDKTNMPALAASRPPWRKPSALRAIRSIRACAAALLLTQVAVGYAASNESFVRPREVPAPADNKLTPPRAELGKTLFFDPRLSKSNWISCASCHNPSLGWSDGLATGFGHNMQRLSRATPTLVNVGYNKILMWDGRNTTLEDQALGPIEAEQEMNLPISELIERLTKIVGYVKMFDQAYPGEGINAKTIGKAIASYERTIVATEAPFDRWLRGDGKAMSASAKRGFELFKGKAECAVCHKGHNFSDDGFHNIGVKDLSAPDLGRYTQRKLDSLRGAFKTPTLRDIALTAPYMRNGVYNTLEEVVEHYDRGGDVKDNLSANIKPLNLTAQEKQDLVAFMKSLTGAPMRVVLPQLPN